MPERVDNIMTIDPLWQWQMTENRLPICECCDEAIRQEKALPIFKGKNKIWLCDRCIEDSKEFTGFED